MRTLHTGEGITRTIITAIALATLAGTAAAAPLKLTLSQAEEMALRNNRQVKIAEQSGIAASAGVAQARATMLPTVSASGSYTRNFEPMVRDMGPLGKIPLSTDNEYSVGLVGTQPLFLGRAGITGYELAKTKLKHSELDVSKTRQEVLLSVREAYLGAVLARSIVDVQTQAVAQAEATLQQVERKHAVGQVSGFELLRAQVEMANTRPGLVTAKSNVKLADANLRLVLGLKDTDVVVPADTLSEFASAWEGRSLKELKAIAWENRPDMRQVAFQNRMAGQGVRLAKSTYYPSVILMAQNAWSGPATDDLTRSASLGVQMSWTLWDSWKTPSSVQSARVSLKQSEISGQLLHDAVALEVESAWSKLQEASENLKSSRQTVAQAREALRLARVLYDAGSSTQLDVLGAQVALTASRTTYATMLHSYQVADARLSKALGLIGKSN